MTEVAPEVPPQSPPPAPVSQPLAEQLSRGRPTHFASAWHWLRSGIGRQGLAASVALVAAWSGVWALLIIASVFLAGAALVAFIGWLIGGGLGGLAGLLAALGVTTGTIIGFIGVLFLGGPGVLISVAGGAVISLAVFGVMVAAEPWTLSLRGYRRMSRREFHRIWPVYTEAGNRLGLATVPPLLIADDGSRSAYTAVRHVVISRTLLLELTDAQVAGVLAHELAHWARADTVGLRFVFAAALPLALLYNLAVLLLRFRGVIAFIAVLLFWPSWALTRLVIEPLLAERGREYEYQADQEARRAGYGQAVAEALEHLGEFEGARSGWEHVIRSTHPPTELRLERLE